MKHSRPTHPRLVIGIPLFIILILSACQSQAASPAGLTPASTGTPSADEARQVVVHALLALNTASNRMSNSTVAADGTVHPNVIEFIPPDRKRITGEGTDIIVAGGKVYLKSSETAPWQTVDIPASTYLGEGTPSQASLEGTVQEAQFVRSDTLDGRDVAVFRYTSLTTTSGVDLHSQTELWIDPADGLPYKMIVDGETLKVSIDPATGENKASAEKTLSTVLISFDPALKIEAPLP